MSFVEINRFLQNPDENVMQIQLVERKGKLLHFSCLEGLSKFSLLVDESGAPKQFESQDETISALLPQINQKIETDKKEKKGNFSIFDSLKIFTEIYLEDGQENEDSDEEMGASRLLNIEPEEEEEEEEIEFEGDEEEAPQDLFDQIIMTPNAETKQEEHQKILSEKLHQKVIKNKRNIEIGETIRNIASVALKPGAKADKEIYLRFFEDGFMFNEDGVLRKESQNKKLLQSLQTGILPAEYSGSAREIDVHVIHEGKTFAKFLEDQAKQKEIEQRMDEQIPLEFMDEIPEEGNDLQQQKAIEESFKHNGTTNSNFSNEKNQLPTASTGAATNNFFDLGSINKEEQEMLMKMYENSQTVIGNNKPTEESKQQQVMHKYLDEIIQDTKNLDKQETTTTARPQKYPQPSEANQIQTQKEEEPMQAILTPSQSYTHSTDSSKPSTKLQFRFNEKRTEISFNTDQTLKDNIYPFVNEWLKSLSGTKNFTLFTAYPRKELDISTSQQTIEELGLSNSTLIVKEKN